MRLCVVHINAEPGSEPYIKLIDEIFSRVKRDDTIIEHRFPRLKRAADLVFGYPYMLNAVDVVHLLAEADREGFDGAMVACTGDPGVAQARSLASIPIVGPFEASLHLACCYGYKIGVVTVQDRAWAEVCEMIVSANGLLGRCAGVRRIEISSASAFTSGFANPSFVAAEIERQARIVVDQGANAIVLGSAGLSCIASAAGLNQLVDLGVPVFDSLCVGLKTLEMRVDLTQKFGLPEISRTGYLEKFAAEDATRVRKLFAANSNTVS